METLVVAIDQTGDVPAHTGVSLPVSGADTISELILELGMADPEDSMVNTLLEAVAIGNEIEAEGDRATIAVLSGNTEGVVPADQAIAEQVDQLLA
ncbi:MAG: DUF373 family protein, partial [Halodesulfurarchaeum sp.]|nr:DUF373 family protein [Halodesulfurarchaeum sp.]